jgi:hypothetical protein
MRKHEVPKNTKCYSEIHILPATIRSLYAYGIGVIANVGSKGVAVMNAFKTRGASYDISLVCVLCRSLRAEFLKVLVSREGQVTTVNSKSLKFLKNSYTKC